MKTEDLRTAVARGRAKVRRVVGARVDTERLAARVTELEAEVQECRQLNLRLAELTDLVQELLLPVAQRDEEKLAALVSKYSSQLG
ncbi:DUF6752 domain-containing protein [Nocardioides alcanivorans]|uniref:DUF6752 domain-containing protein n=1 Tax=Nocardioides alcanivorans TaxID=2897352 RepID=UPI001F3B0617|nr:DUF6752 domain-containing protein [Nocardioides alcanivorans]